MILNRATDGKKYSGFGSAPPPASSASSSDDLWNSFADSSSKTFSVVAEKSTAAAGFVAEKTKAAATAITSGELGQTITQASAKGWETAKDVGAKSWFAISGLVQSAFETARSAMVESPAAAARKDQDSQMYHTIVQDDDQDKGLTPVETVPLGFTESSPIPEPVPAESAPRVPRPVSVRKSLASSAAALPEPKKDEDPWDSAWGYQ